MLRDRERGREKKVAQTMAERGISIKNESNGKKVK